MKKLILILPLLLMGCISQEEIAAKEEQAEIAECTKLGFKPDTDAFRNCRLQVMAIREQKKSAVAAAIVGANSHPYHPVSCNTIGANTTCY